jgi:RimJ/RimL family protein N-acetyltransferase
MIWETERLRLRRLTVEDAEFVLRLASEPSFLEHIGDKGLRTLEDAERFLRDGYWTCQDKPGYGQFLVELKGSGAPVGVCGLLYREKLRVSDIGFALLPEYWGSGLAFEAASAVLRYGSEELGVERIVGLTTTDNLPSIKLLEKLGMKHERTVKMAEDDPGTEVYS